MAAFQFCRPLQLPRSRRTLATFRDGVVELRHTSGQRQPLLQGPDSSMPHLGLELQPEADMDPSFLPAELTIKHLVNHRFTLELGPSITTLGRGVRNLIIAVVVIKCSFSLVERVTTSVLNNRPGRNTR